MTTEINNEKEKQQEEEEKKKLEQFEKEQHVREIEQEINYKIEFSKQIYDLTIEIINEWINRNFKYENNNIVLRKRAKMSNKWVLLITKMYRNGIINYDFEKKKFIINTEINNKCILLIRKMYNYRIIDYDFEKKKFIINIEW